MPARDFLKTDNEDVLKKVKKIENRFIIKKDNSISGRLFFDYDGEQRIEIKSKNVVYNVGSLEDDKILLENLSIYGNESNVTENDIILGSLISDGNNIGIINSIEDELIEGENKKIVNIDMIYSTKSLMWNDYRDK